MCTSAYKSFFQKLWQQFVRSGSPSFMCVHRWLTSLTRKEEKNVTNMNVLKLCEVQMYIAQNDATYIRELKRTPSAKFETMISEPRPKQRKSGQSN